MSQQAKRIKVNDCYIPLLQDKSRYLILYGGSGCFDGSQKVVTDNGNKDISSIAVGDNVLSYNHELKRNEFRRVTEIFKYDNHVDRIFRIKLKDGTTIEVTENHEFFYGGAYVKIKDILLSLRNETMEENT